MLAHTGLRFPAGYFFRVGEQERHHLAAFDVKSGARTEWDPSPADPVATLAISGPTVYAGGSFGAVGGEARRGLAAMDLATGKLTDWNPELSRRGRIETMVVSGGTLYVGGAFDQVAKQNRRGLAA